MLALAIRNTNKLIRRYVAEQGIRIGRTFAKREVAEAMVAPLAIPVGEELRVLDVGAGTGILSAAWIERLCREHDAPLRIALDAYETDERMLPMLADNLERIRKKCRHDYGVILAVRVCAVDFFTETAWPQEGYHTVLLNPPVGVASPASPAEAYAKQHGLCGADLSSLFLAAAADRLREDGQLSACLPLSFADSVRTAPLRKALFAKAPPVAVSLFAPSEQGKLRNTLLVSFAVAQPPETVAFTVKEGTRRVCLTVPYATAIFGEECKVILARNQEDITLLRMMHAMPNTLSRLGMTVRTGLAIEARYPAYLRSTPTEGAIPLLHPAGIADGRVSFPTPGRPKPYLVPCIPSLAQPNRTMLLIKRVPTKADGRRLVCGVYFSAQLPHAKALSTANKLNVIQAKRGEMSADLACGLYAVLSSAYYERYCRLTGSCRLVNATALTALPLPEETLILSIGRRLSVVRNLSRRVCDAVASAALGALFNQYTEENK